MKNELEKWIYKYTEVFNDKLTEQHAKMSAFSFETKPDPNWHIAQANKAPPRYQMMTKDKEVERFIKKC